MKNSTAVAFGSVVVLLASGCARPDRGGATGEGRQDITQECANPDPNKAYVVHCSISCDVARERYGNPTLPCNDLAKNTFSWQEVYATQADYTATQMRPDNVVCTMNPWVSPFNQHNVNAKVRSVAGANRPMRASEDGDCNKPVERLWAQGGWDADWATCESFGWPYWCEKIKAAGKPNAPAPTAGNPAAPTAGNPAAPAQPAANPPARPPAPAMGGNTTAPSTGGMAQPAAPAPSTGGMAQPAAPAPSTGGMAQPAAPAPSTGGMARPAAPAAGTTTVPVTQPANVPPNNVPPSAPAKYTVKAVSSTFIKATTAQAKAILSEKDKCGVSKNASLPVAEVIGVAPGQHVIVVLTEARCGFAAGKQVHLFKPHFLGLP